MRAALVLLLFVASNLGARAQAAPARPDIILVTIDTLRADHVGCYGYKEIKTPALDRLCADGMRFDQAFTPSPITNSSHASIFTGLYPSSHEVSDFGVPLAASHVTLAELLQRSGYATAAFIGAVILDSKTLAIGFDRGFDHYDNFPAQPPSSERWERVERRAEEVVRRARMWLSKNTVQPRFLWVHLYDPHDPYQPPPPYSEIYKRNLYDGEIAYADHALELLLEELDRQRRYDGSLIVVMGDHGEGLGEHGENTHGIFLYNSTTHIPFIIKLPGRQKAAKVYSQPVSTLDLLPTVLDLLKISSSAHYDGRSLAPLFKADTSYERPLLAETDYPLHFGWAPLKSVRSQGYKYIEAPRPELYDLHSDSREQRDLYQPWDPKVQKLRSLLADFRKANPPPPAGHPAAVDPKTIEELSALGYLGTNPGATTASEPSMLPDPKDKIKVHNLIHAALMEEDDGRVDTARTALRQALDLDPNSAVALSQLGQIELRSGQFKTAAQYLARAYRLRPEDASTALALGKALEKNGDLQPARDVLERVLKVVPGQYEARLALARIYFALNNPVAAEDQLEAAIFLDDKKPDARLLLARVLLFEKQPEQALAQLRAALVSNPENQEIKKMMRQLFPNQVKPH